MLDLPHQIERRKAMNGSPHCLKCKGTGMISVSVGKSKPCRIFCNECHDEDKIAAFWKYTDNYCQPVSDFHWQRKFQR
jgi:hypothetical protein